MDDPTRDSSADQSTFPSVTKTAEDVRSSGETPLPQTVQSDAPPPSQPLTYEETPIIEPVSGEAIEKPSQPPSASVQQPVGIPQEPWVSQGQPTEVSQIGRYVKTTVLFGGLFLVGVAASVFLRQFIPTGVPSPTNEPSPEVRQTQQPVPPSAPQETILPAPSALYPDWRTYGVTSGVTKQAVAGISLKLPPEVQELFCDGTTCASQGTYLPGGTRFTVAPRGKGQILADFRGSQLTDAAGRPFTVKNRTVAGRPAIEFMSSIGGTTAGGYSFLQMRGVMIEVDDQVSLEINHFTPSGISADFESDDVLFDKILETVTLTTSAPPTPAAMP